VNLEAVLRKKLPLLLSVSLGLLAVNLAVYFLGVSRLGKHTQTTQAKVAAVREQLLEVEKQRAETTSTVGRVRTDKQVVEELTGKVFMTRGERVVAMQTELLKLGEASRLQMDIIAYTYTLVPEVEKRWERQYLKMGIQFTVSGSYQDIKGFIEALQESPQFFIVEGVTLSSDSQSAALLRVGISLSTYFVATGQDLTTGSGGRGGA
jgi:Tfp pilus assembly protein PilO